MFDVNTSGVTKSHQLTQERLRSAMEHLSSGTKLFRPGDEVVDFERVSVFDYDKIRELAQLQSIQARVSWFQTSVSYLTDIRDTLSHMSSLALAAKSSGGTREDKEVGDATFQELKRHLIEVVDGFSGSRLPAGVFAEMPLFIGYDPNVEIGSQMSTIQDDFKGPCLYTAAATPGFETVPLLTDEEADAAASFPNVDDVIIGTVPSDTPSSSLEVKLAVGSSAVDDAYNNKVITITKDGAMERRTIMDYDGATRVATLSSAVTIPDLSDANYEIDLEEVPRQSICLLGTVPSDTPSSTTQLKLGVEASAIDDVYVSKAITIVKDGVEENHTIVDYDARTRIVTLDSAVTTIASLADASYSIDSGVDNFALVSLNEDTSLKFANFVWGADNYRFDWLGSGDELFVSLTEEERIYRDANGIPNTNLVPQTYEEKMARRELNIFDVEFGNIATKENAARMFSQVNNAVEQISLLITREDAKIANMNGQFAVYDRSADYYQQGIEELGNVDYADESLTLQELTNAHQRIMEVAARISDNYRKLTDLVK